MTRLLNAFHVFLLSQYMNDCRGSAPAPAVLDGGEEEWEIRHILHIVPADLLMCSEHVRLSEK